MIFNDNRPIYLQIADYVCDQILWEKWKIGERILSVRELGSLLEVNPNTALRALEMLQNMEIIINKRGVGYFVNEDAIAKIRNFRRERFFKEELPSIFKTMQILQIEMTKIEEEYAQFLKSTQ